MRRPGRALLLLIATAVGLGAVSAVAPLPAAAFATPWFHYVESWTSNPGVIRASVSSETSIASVTVVVQEAEGDPTPGRVWNFTRQGTGNLWVSEQMLLNVGVWVGAVTATEEDGDTSTVGVRIDYRYLTKVRSVDISTQTLTFEGPTVKASGALTALDPRTRKEEMIPDGEVQLWFGSLGRRDWLGGSATVAEDGTFALSAVPSGFEPDETRLTAELRWFPDPSTVIPDLLYALPGGEPPVLGQAEIGVVSRPSRVVLDATSLTVKAPGKTLVTGIVEMQDAPWYPPPDDVPWYPAPDVVLRVEGAASSVSVRTGEDGRFAATLPLTADATVSAMIDEPVRGAFLQAVPGPVADSVTVRVVPTASLSWTVRSIDARSNLTLRGALQKSNRQPWNARATVELQRSANGRTGWGKVLAVKAGADGRIDSVRKVAHPSGYFRLAFAGSAEAQPATTRAYRLSRTEARIVKATASPSTVKKGKKITVRGKAQKLSGDTFVSVGNRKKIKIYFRTAKGDWGYQGSVLTTSTGTFSKQFTAKRDGYWRAVWFTPSSKWVNGYSRDMYVNVIS